MVRVEIDVDRQTVTLEPIGFGKLWAFKRRLHFPAAQLRSVERIERARLTPPARSLGSYLPGVIAAGTFYQRRKKVFALLREGRPALLLTLEGGEYDEIMVQTADLEGDLKRLSELL